MKHNYQVNGITCMGCVAKVEETLNSIPGILKASVDLNSREAEIEMSHHIATEVMNEALSKIGGYSLKDMPHHPVETPSPPTVQEEMSVQTYKPLLLVVAYLLGAVLIQQYLTGWQVETAMSFFMGAFFITFSFFKMLDLKGFAMSYYSYDIIARRWYNYGYVYPFIELALGIAYLTGVWMIGTHIATLVVMSISIIGVVKSVMDKRKIKCACLGTVFNLPMSTVTIVEDGSMIAMALGMILINTL